MNRKSRQSTKIGATGDLASLSPIHMELLISPMPITIGNARGPTVA